MQTDVPVKSISIGLKSRVWCVAQDSSCYMRAGIEKEKTIGSNWLHLPRETQNICQLSIGKRVITAIDDKGIFISCPSAFTTTFTLNVNSFLGLASARFSMINFDFLKFLEFGFG